ncbi:SOS response-associated peptidase [Pseudohoeflea coraliihabitans]|uniref:Abasic site processing protein n=1 Tax=Pseudohoeflea coraliihabitans TaxID=2860393 RepID=A0ABS6WS63_9HYPH|nr:SOS response-associated peptidase [Pseudohoeflea sp. DP4N28-3]MBW3097889.1 SOS response-associated peptidase [Pseudohoeflea sp. DP4N28-3]
MCGRFSLTASPEEVQEFFGLDEIEDFPPRYNIAPTQPILIVAGDVARAPGDNRAARRAVLVRWGLLPSWVKDPREFPLLINARSETAAGKNSFRAAMRHHRVLVAASGFYEWRRGAKGSKEKSTPFWIRPRHGGVVAFAGLMETYLPPDGSEIDTGAILTVAANQTLAPIHDRMPVVIEPQDFARWLDCKTQEPRDVADLLTPAADDFFEAVRVSDAVNKVANTGAELQSPVAEPTAAKTVSTRSTPAAAPTADQLKLL